MEAADRTRPGWFDGTHRQHSWVPIVPEPGAHRSLCITICACDLPPLSARGIIRHSQFLGLRLRTARLVQRGPPKPPHLCSKILQCAISGKAVGPSFVVLPSPCRNLPSRLAYASLLKSEPLLPASSDAGERHTVSRARQELEKRLGAEAAAICRNLQLAISEAASLTM